MAARLSHPRHFCDERLQNGGGGEASGPGPTPTDSSNQTFFQHDIQEWGGSGSIKHKPSGLFTLVAGMWSDQGDSDTIHAGVFTGTSAPQMSSWEVQLGIQRKMGPLGALGDNSSWGGFAEVNNDIGAGSNGNGGNLGGLPADRFLKAGTFADVTVPTEFTGADVNRWSLGLDQGIQTHPACISTRSASTSTPMSAWSIRD